MKHIDPYVINEGEDDNKVNQIIAILNATLKPGKDKGSSQAIIDTHDFKEAAEAIVKLFKKV